LPDILAVLADRFPARRLPLSKEALEQLFNAILDGSVSIRYAAALLGWTVDDVCEVVFGDIVL
jgi:hypothetical protein